MLPSLEGSHREWTWKDCDQGGVLLMSHRISHLHRAECIVHAAKAVVEWYSARSSGKEFHNLHLIPKSRQNYHHVHFHLKFLDDKFVSMLRWFYLVFEQIFHFLHLKCITVVCHTDLRTSIVNISKCKQRNHLYEREKGHFCLFDELLFWYRILEHVQIRRVAYFSDVLHLSTKRFCKHISDLLSFCAQCILHSSKKCCS